MAWTRFMDMHSGGATKVLALQDGTYTEGSNWRNPEGALPKEYIYIEAPENEARVIFYNRFGHNPERVTCTCCGDDYSIGEHETLAEASAYDRGCDYDDAANGYVERPATKYAFHQYMLLDDYVRRPDVLVIGAAEITDAERHGDIPRQGYVWVD